MTLIPQNPVSQADLTEWYNIQAELKRLKAAESVLRSKIYKGLFPNAIEGTNSHPLDGGYVLKAVRKVERKIDVAAFKALRAEEDSDFTNLPLDALVVYKPEVVMRAYRALSDEQRHLFDQALTIKDGSPSLEIVLPASAKAQ